ncbi:MAG: CsgG/HfaB family protein [Flavobacteriales bacterium]
MNLINKFIKYNFSKSTPVLKTMAQLLLVCFSISLFSSCSGSKAFYKRGFKLEEQGMVDEAAAAYYTSLQRNRNNVDAKIGLKSAGQQVLNKKLEAFIRAKNLEQKKEAVYQFIDVKDYQAKIKRIGVTLEIPTLYDQDYLDITQSYLADLYDEGTELLEQGNFTDAETLFKEIGKFDSNYKDAQNLEDIAFLEPLYKEGLANLEKGNFRTAYNDFDGVVNRDPTFKDAAELKTLALESGLVTLAIVPFTNNTSYRGLDTKVSAYSLNALTKLGDPFLKVIDRENFQLIIDEQQLGMSGVIDDETAVNAGNLIGAKTLLTGTVLSFSEDEGRLQKTTQQGYESYRVKRLNPETEKYFYETKYRPATYFKYQKRNSVTVSFQYKITSLETGEVLDSEIIQETIDDTVVYADYSGNNDSLFPARNTGVNTNRSAKNDLNRLLGARRTIKNTAELSNQLMEQVSFDLSKNIEILMSNVVK